MSNHEDQQLFCSDFLDHNTQARLDQLEEEVWKIIAVRTKQARRLTSAFGGLTFLIVFAGSCGAGAIHGTRTGLHQSVAIELSQGGDFLTGQLE